MERLLFFSCEAKGRSASYLMNMTYPVCQKFNELYSGKYANEKLKNITIIFICTDDAMINEGFYNERRYISWKNNYADIRLQIPYMQFINADNQTRKEMVWNVIEKALNYVRVKKAFLKIDDFEKDLRLVYWNF